jgi:hypothetical protein
MLRGVSAGLSVRLAVRKSEVKSSNTAIVWTKE